MEDAIETIEKDGYTLTIYLDDCPESPREWDNLGKLYIPHNPRGYSLGDKDASAEECAASPLKLPVYILSHGGIAISTLDYHDSWDSWQAGYIYVTAETLDNEYLIHGYTMEKALGCARKCLLGEIDMYNDYLQGAVYGFEIADAESEIESYWGYYGDRRIQDIKDLFDGFLAREKQEKAEQARQDAIAAAPLFVWGKIDPDPASRQRINNPPGGLIPPGKKKRKRYTMKNAVIYCAGLTGATLLLIALELIPEIIKSI